MTTSGTYAYNPDIADIVTDAFDLCGIQDTTGYDARGARRSLEMVTLDMTNRGLNLWTIDQETENLVDGTAAYTLSASGTVDVLDAVIRNGDNDTQLTRLTPEEYLKLPDKTIEGTPTQFMVLRGVDGITVTLYPVPDDSTLDFVYYRIRHIQDTGTARKTMDVPRRLIPALTFGLAYFVALKNRERVPQDVRSELERKYEQALQFAFEEDRDRSSFRIIPRLG